MKQKLNTLICTLGGSAPVVTETIDAMSSQENIKIDKLIIVHTNSNDIFEKTTKTGKEIGLTGLQKYIKANFPGILFEKPINIGLPDIASENDNSIFLEKLIDVINEEKNTGNNVYIGMAGGRKTMSAIAVFAAYLVGCDGIYHVLTTESDFVLVEQYGFKIPVDKLNLIPVPLINLSGIIDSIMFENKEKIKLNPYYFFKNNKNVIELFNKLHSELKQNIQIHQLRIDYEERWDKADRLRMAVENILKLYANECNIFRPQVESRVKTFQSTLENLFKESAIKGKEFSIESVEDLIGCRIICCFQKDVDTIVDLIENSKDFKEIKIIPKKDTWGYNARHFIAKLSKKRTDLIEYSDLTDMKCEIQVKTIFDDAWAKLSHRLRYKSEKYDALSEKEKDEINNTFIHAAGTLKGLEEKFRSVRKLYSKK